MRRMRSLKMEQKMSDSEVRPRDASEESRAVAAEDKPQADAEPVEEEKEDDEKDVECKEASKAIDVGTVLVCRPPSDEENRHADIYESATSEDIIGTIKEGEQVTAAGPPEKEEGYEAMLPIEPKGAVELSLFHMLGSGKTEEEQGKDEATTQEPIAKRQCIRMSSPDKPGEEEDDDEDDENADPDSSAPGWWKWTGPLLDGGLNSFKSRLQGFSTMFARSDSMKDEPVVEEPQNVEIDAQNQAG